MPEVALPISASQAERDAAAYQRKMNSGLNIPRVLPMLAKLAEQEKVYIYNTGPYTYQRHMGSTGTFLIPACEQDQDYSKPLEYQGSPGIPGIVFEPVKKSDEKNMELIQDEGLYVANEILGIGKHHDRKQSLDQRGVFISHSNPPKKHEVEAAKAKLRKYFQRLVNEMNDAHSQGAVKRQEVQTEEHFIAARALKLTTVDCPWLANSDAPATRALCEGCGANYVVGSVMRCNCGFILDIERYNKAVEAGQYGPDAKPIVARSKPVQPPVKN